MTLKMSKDEDYTNIIRLLACTYYMQQYCQSRSGVEIQELSYRKQIACQLRTQYVEGIYRSNYWIDHT